MFTKKPLLTIGAVLLVATATAAAAPESTFAQRRDQVLNDAVAQSGAPDLQKGGLLDIAVCFQTGRNVDWANRRLAALLAGPQAGDMFWMFPIVTVMETGRTVLTPANRARLRACWKEYFPYRGDTENHWILYYSTLYLAAEANPGAGPEAWYNGKSSAENMAEAKDYLTHWMMINTAHGQGEFDSPNYIEEYTSGLGLLAGYCKDPQLQHLSKMMLDYIFYGYVVQQIDGEFGGAHSRVYPRQVVQPSRSPAASLGWVLFGIGDYQPHQGTEMLLACTDYQPPEILNAIAHTESPPYVERELKRTRWHMRHPGPDAIEVTNRSTVPVYKYTYVDSDFILGCCQGGLLQPIQQETWSLIWKQGKGGSKLNTFFGLQPYSSSFEGTMYFAAAAATVTDLITRSKADYDSPDKLVGGSPYEQVWQDGSALIALYDIPEGTRFPQITTFFSRDLEERQSDPSGWIFAKAGPAYLAYFPLAPGTLKPMGWTGLLKGGAGGWFSAGYGDFAQGNQCLVSEALHNGYVVQVASHRDYATLGEFKAAVLKTKLKVSTDPVPEVTYTTLAGSRFHARYGSPPEIDGQPVDFAGWPLFDGPFGHSTGERKLEIKCGALTYTLDFQTALAAAHAK